MAITQYFLGFVLIVVTTFVLYFKWTYGYWKRRNITYIEPSMPFGNMENPLNVKKGLNGILDEAYRDFKSKGNKFGGLFFLHKPTLLLLDPDLIRSVLTKDFNHFRNHGNFIDEENEPVTASLLNLEDEKWRNLRTKVTPIFTAGKMKTMFDAILSCGDQLVEHISDLCSQRKPLDLKEIFGCYGTDVIGSCAFGIDCNSFKDPDAEFRKYGRKLMEPNWWFTVRVFVAVIVPELNKILKLKTFPTDATDFLSKAFKSVVDQRNSTNTKRNDFVQLLLELSTGHGQSSATLSMNEMIAQAFIFFVGGFDTSSTTLAFCFYELALQPDIQQRVRDEISGIVKDHNGQLTYDGIMDMKYMDQVIDETMRKYPSFTFINRQCSETYRIPGTDAVIEKGTSVIVSIRSLQNDGDHFPNPDKFDPERFSKENKGKMHPYTFIPFGEGPRVCIGRRFAIMQIKIGLSLILKDFKIVPHETTPKVIVPNPRNAVGLLPKEALLLNAEIYKPSK